MCLRCSKRRRCRFDPWVRKIPWRRAWQPAPVFLSGESHRQRSLAGHSPRICEDQQWPQDWKMSVFIPIPKKGNDKECSNYHTIALISHTGKVMLKILQARFQQYVNRELMFKLVLEKAEEPEIKLPTPTGHRKSKRVREKHLFLLY